MFVDPVLKVNVGYGAFPQKENQNRKVYGWLNNDPNKYKLCDLPLLLVRFNQFSHDACTSRIRKIVGRLGFDSNLSQGRADFSLQQETSPCWSHPTLRWRSSSQEWGIYLHFIALKWWKWWHPNQVRLAFDVWDKPQVTLVCLKIVHPIPSTG